MKRLLLVVACTLAARCAMADGSDLRTVSCAGDLWSSSGMPLPVALTFRPHDAIADLDGLTATLHLTGPTTGTMYDYAAFPASLGITRIAPAGCDAAADVWNVDGATASVTAERVDPYDLVLHVTCTRPSGVAVAAAQLVFGALVELGSDPAAEPYEYDAGVSVGSVVPHSTAGGDQAALTGGAVYLIGGLPAKRTSWSRLKSLYR